MDFGAQEIHAVYVQCLSFGIDFTHEDFAFHAEEGGNGSSGYAVLAGAGFGDEAGLAHPFCLKGRADAVCVLMGAGVVEVFSFKKDLGSTDILGKIFSIIERRFTTDILFQKLIQFCLKRRICLTFSIGFF